MIDDEVSIVINHFQQKPALISSTTPTPIIIKKSTQSKKTNNRNFSCVYFCKQKKTLRLTYRHDRIIILRFEVDCVGPYYTISHIISQDSYDDDNFVNNNNNGYGGGKEIVAKVNEICANLSIEKDSQNKLEEEEENKASLFSIISKLLLALNKLPTQYPGTNNNHARKKGRQDVVQEQSDLLRRSLLLSSSSERSSQKSSSSSSSSTPHNRRRTDDFWDVFDLKILLLRYAAAGKHASTFCYPFPDEFHQIRRQQQAVVAPANLVLGATSYLHSQEFRRQPKNKRRCLNYPEQELIAFLMSLSDPAAQTSIKRLVSSSSSSVATTTASTSTTKRVGRTVVTTLCWDLETAIRGDESPRFTQLAKRYGVATAYHGTKMDNVWSILNCGFCSLSDTRFAHNGGMLGQGVYFSTSKDVASFFAASNNKPVNPIVWQHMSLINLLGPTTSINVQDLMNDYTVSCFPVFEAQIILPPPPPTTTTSRPTSSKSVPGTTNGSSSSTRREGTYLVVPNPQDIRILKLYLTFELEKKRQFTWYIPLLVVIAGMIFYHFYFATI